MTTIDAWTWSVVWTVVRASVWVLIPWHFESVTPLSVMLLVILARWVVVEVTTATWLLAWLWCYHIYLYKASITVESYNKATWLASCIIC